MSVIYRPKGMAREYSPYALNIYIGCSHQMDWTKKGVIEKVYKATEFYRNSDYTIDEIKYKVQNDADLCSRSANLNPEILM